MDYSFNDLKPIIDDNYDSFSAFDSKLKDKNKKLDFNIFDVISNKWHYENFHSIMLKFIFENDKCFFDLFLTYIGIDNKDDYKNADIQTEYTIDNNRRIDILITGNNHAIIVENKLNYAHDLENQLHDYYKHISKNEGLEVDKVVYISPSIYKNPNKITYGDDEGIKKEIIGKQEIIYGCILNNKDDSKKDLYTCLNNAMNKMGDKKSDYFIFCKHYLEILKRIGSSYMNDEQLIRNNFLKEIKNCSEKNIGKKLSYMKDMLNNLNRTRVDFFTKAFGDNNITSTGDWNNNMHVGIIIPLNIEGIDVEIRIYIDTLSFEETKIFIENHSYNQEESNEYNKKIQNILNSQNIDTFKLENWADENGYHRFERTFSFLKDDENIVEEVANLYNILNSNK